MTSSLLYRILAAIFTLEVMAHALVVLGAFVPALPIVGIAGSGLSQRFWHLTVLAVVGAAISGVALRQRRTRWRTAVFAVALLELTGSVVIGVRLVHLAHRYDVPLGLTGLAPAEPHPLAPDDTYTYTTDEHGPVQLSVWRPHRIDVPAGGAPVIMFVHGGGWIHGNRLEWAGHKRWFADRGWVVVSVDYTLSNSRRHLWATTENQIGCAMTWVNRHAREIGADTTRFAMSGDSAGGNLALNVAYRADAGTLAPTCPGALPKVRAVSVLYPAVDPVAFHDNPNVPLGGVAREMTDAYTGGTPSRYPDRYAAVSTATHVRPDSPPTQIMVGENDHLVPPRATYDVADLIRDRGVRTRLIRVPFADHVFDRASRGVGSQVFRVTTQRWFESAGAGPG